MERGCKPRPARLFREIRSIPETTDKSYFHLKLSCHFDERRNLKTSTDFSSRRNDKEPENRVKKTGQNQPKFNTPVANPVRRAYCLTTRNPQS
jgi:hypothetical protein